MPFDNAKNGARATLALGITAGATSVTLTTGHGSRMPSVPFNAWIYNATDYADDPFDDPNYEIVKVTARSTDTLTIRRAQEGTAAATHNTSGKSYRLVAGLTALTINSLTTYYNAKSYGLAGDGVTDDTNAFQSLIDYLRPLGGGKIYFPPGAYVISGALQDTSARNAQILLPVVSAFAAPVTIELIGALAPPTQFYTGSPATVPATAYSIIKSTLTGGSGGSFIAGQGAADGSLWNNVQLIVRDLVFQAPPNPTFTAFNCESLMGPHFSQVLIHTGSLDIGTMAEPTNGTAVGIRLAPSAHSTGQTLNVVNVYGFFIGMIDGELAEVHANFVGCKRAVHMHFNHHLSSYRHLGIFNCPTGIRAEGSHYVRINCLALEHNNSGGGYGPAWADRVYDIDDASNQLKGDIHWLSIQAGVGNDHSLTKNGGTGLLTTEIGT